MSYNGFVIICILLGAFFGFFIFGWEYLGVREFRSVMLNQFTWPLVLIYATGKRNRSRHCVVIEAAWIASCIFNRISSSLALPSTLSDQTR